MNKLNGNMATAKALFIRYNFFFMFVILIVISSLVSGDFLTERNIYNLFRQNAGLCVLSMGMLMVILTGGIDLSVGSLVAVSSVFLAYCYVSLSVPIWLAIVFCLISGMVIGMVSGALVSYAKIAPFIATLALMTIARGIAYVVSDGSPILIKNSPLGALGTGYFLKVPYLIWFMVLITVITVLILRYTSYGRVITAIGSNENAVRLSGINTAVYKLSVYGIAGLCGGLAGMISTARTDVGSPVIGSGMELDAIAAVVIGGASLSGGKGSAFATFMGVLILGLINNIMNLLSVPAYPQEIIKGLIIIFAVLLQILNKRDCVS